MKLAIDTCILTIVCNDQHREHAAVTEWLGAFLDHEDSEVYLPAIADYELRRKLLHLARRDKLPKTLRSLQRLDSLIGPVRFLTLTEAVMRDAASLWAQARYEGKPTASPVALDGDVLLAAQAIDAGAVVVTDNRKHITRYCTVADWRTVPAP